MKRAALALGIASTLSALGVGEREAAACGGCFHPPTQTISDITDERMLFSVSAQQTTLYDQLRYTGNPTDFAWVLPIKGTVQVGLSADVMFGAFDALTQTQIPAPPTNCPSPANCRYFGAPQSTSAGAAGPGGNADLGTVTVLKQENVGPYATVQLSATTPAALDGWLQQNGYMIPADVLPVINAYLGEGFDFLAMKLLPSAGVSAMRPVRVTTPGAGLSLPLRMAGVGTGAKVGITIWVVADGRYEPQNFPFFHIDDSELVWDFKTSSSNYTTLRTQKEAALMNGGWEMESSITLNEQVITNVILSGGQYTGGLGGGGVAYSGPADPSADYLPIGDPDAGAGADGGATETAEQVRTADIAALFVGLTGANVRVTRIRSDIAHAAMTKDFLIQASTDQSELPNVRNVTKSVNLTCPIYSGCSVVGTGTPEQAALSVSGGTTGGGGCAAAVRSNRTGAGLGALAALLGTVGLVVARVARARRRAASKNV